MRDAVTWRPEWRGRRRRIPRTGVEVMCAVCPRHGVRVRVRFDDGVADFVIEDPHGDPTLVLACALTLDEIHAEMAAVCAGMERVEAAP